MDLSSYNQQLNNMKDDAIGNLATEENRSKIDNSKQNFKENSGFMHSNVKSPFNELNEQSRNVKAKVFEDSNLLSKSMNKRKKLKFKQPFIEYVDIESFKTFNSLMCFSDPHSEPKTKKCKCIVY